MTPDCTLWRLSLQASDSLRSDLYLVLPLGATVEDVLKTLHRAKLSTKVVAVNLISSGVNFS